MSILPVSTSNVRQIAATKVEARQAEANAPAHPQPLSADSVEDAEPASPYDGIFDRTAQLGFEGAYEAEGDYRLNLLQHTMAETYGSTGALPTLEDAKAFVQSDARFAELTPTEQRDMARLLRAGVAFDSRQQMYMRRRPQLTPSQIEAHALSDTSDLDQLASSLTAWIDEQREAVSIDNAQTMGGLGHMHPVADAYVDACHDAADLYYQVAAGDPNALPEGLQARYDAYLSEHPGDLAGAYMEVRDDLNARFRNRAGDALYGGADPYTGYVPHAVSPFASRDVSPYERPR